MLSLPLRVLWRALLPAVLILPLALRAAAESRQTYDLPAGEAPTTLRQFSEQSGREVLFAAEAVRGVHTNAVHGEYTPREALDLVLADTALVAVADPQSGALAVSRRENPAPEAPAKSKPGRPAEPAADEIVQLGQFTVTTALGRYSESNTSGATKMPTEFRDLPSTLQVLNSSLLGDLRALTIEDTYRYVVGMTEASTNNNGFTLRGFSGMGPNQSSLTYDGMPGAATRFGSPTTANVERVEIIKGPTSVLYGQNNPGGLVNIVSKRPLEHQADSVFFSAATYAGSLLPAGRSNSYTTTIDSTGPLDDGKHWLYRLILSGEDLQRPRTGDYMHNAYVWPSLTYRLDKDTWVTMQADLVQQRRRADDGLVAPFNTVALVARYDTVYQEANDVDGDHGDVLTTSFGHNFTNGWSLRGTLRTVWHYDTRYALENASVTSAAVLANSTVGRRLREQYNGHRYNFGDLNAYGDWVTGPITHALLVGINGGIEYFDQDRLAFGPNVAALNLYAPVLGVAVYPVPTPSTQTDNQTNYYNYGAYVSDQLKFGSHWIASLGFRHDQQDQDNVELHTHVRRSQSQGTNLPSFGLVFEPVNEVSLYASYCRGFKNSDVTSVDANGNPGFPPESSHQVEVGAKADLLDRKLSVTAAAYDIKKDNVVEVVPNTFLPDGTAVRRLVGEQESRGVELQTTYLPVPNWQLLAGWTYIDARVNRTLTVANINAHLAEAPRYSGNFWTRYNVPNGLWKGFGAGLGFYYSASFLGNSTNTPASYLEVPAFARVDTAFYYDWARYSLALNVGNVLDRKFIQSANTNVNIIAGDPRKLTLSMRVRF
ncbi:MAG: TonB-dependent siderophore receptor [Opitutales bacterium]